MKRILWFRRDLRVDDNRLLTLPGAVLPIFIFDPVILDPLERNDRRVAFIFDAVLKLKAALQARGLDLALFYGSPEAVFDALGRIEADEVCASGDYDRYARERDRRVSLKLPFHRLHDTYIFRPDAVLKANGTPYLVFTPFYKQAKTVFRPEHLHEAKAVSQTLIPFDFDGVLHIEKGKTFPATLASIGFEAEVPPVASPETLWSRFAPTLGDYPTKRDFLSEEATSGLSVHLRFGTLGIRTLLRWVAARKREGIDTEPFFRQLVFRDFYAMLLYHFPHLQERNFRYTFNGVENDERFQAFCDAKTGVPVVDAGIRQLVQTGRMHNRVRMLCASFLTKDLLLPWQWGERFFATHLLDYDAASNALSWQWSAGTGIDPQPYFRVFNPYTQGKKFDPEGRYVKRWLPEYDAVPAAKLHDEAWLSAHAPRIAPIVAHKEVAKRAVDAFKASDNAV